MTTRAGKTIEIGNRSIIYETDAGSKQATLDGTGSIIQYSDTTIEWAFDHQVRRMTGTNYTTDYIYQDNGSSFSRVKTQDKGTSTTIYPNQHIKFDVENERLSKYYYFNCLKIQQWICNNVGSKLFKVTNY